MLAAYSARVVELWETPMHVLRLGAISQAIGLATTLLASTSFASDWVPVQVGERCGWIETKGE